MRAALAVFAQIEATCSRFKGSSDLSRVNAGPATAHAVAPELFAVIVEAFQAYRETEGLFDPRVLGDLCALGYSESFSDELGMSSTTPPPPARSPLPAWNPLLTPPGTINVGPLPLDLGGIGKSMAVRFAAARLREACSTFLVEAGGDIFCGGSGPDGSGWVIGVEDPWGSGRPVAALRLHEAACCTSSTRFRSWRRAGHPVHHLIDPATGMPGDEGLVAVTVVTADAATAEVWSKAFFLKGQRDIMSAAEDRGMAVLWVQTDGSVCWSSAMQRHIMWTDAASVSDRGLYG